MISLTFLCKRPKKSTVLLALASVDYGLMIVRAWSLASC